MMNAETRLRRKAFNRSSVIRPCHF